MTNKLYRLDVVAEGLEACREYCDRHGIQFQVISLEGPGGGNPEVEVRGEERALEILLSDWGFSNEDFLDGTIR